VPRERVYLGLGANLGDRLATLRAAVRDLSALGEVTARSSVWETEAVGPPPDYLNAALALETDLTPDALMLELLALEARHGRLRGAARDAPRPLDLDILLWDERIVHTAIVEVPHPRLHERAFVLEPLAEIAPSLRHPLLHCSIDELRSSLPRSRRARRLSDPL
jgi:2-amino-4-hydroxy-6-hydroxymethyldihydropteridine diphosphokinase